VACIGFGPQFAARYVIKPTAAPG